MASSQNTARQSQNQKPLIVDATRQRTRMTLEDSDHILASLTRVEDWLAKAELELQQTAFYCHIRRLGEQEQRINDLRNTLNRAKRQIQAI